MNRLSLNDYDMLSRLYILRNARLKENSEEMGIKLFTFFIWPFGAWLYSLRDPRRKSSYIVFFLFSCLLLWHMAPANMTDGYQDFIGTMSEFNEKNITTESFFHEVEAYFSFSSDAPKELYQDFLTWVTKLFTDNYHFMFLLAAVPVAFLQLKSLQLVTSDKNFVLGFYGVVTMTMLLLPRDIIAVQNPRFTTGFWLFVCCSLYSFTKNKIIYLLPTIFLPLFHSAMWAALIICCVYLLIPKGNTKLLEFVAFFSIIFAFFDSNLTSLFDFSILPDNIVVWAERYSSDEYYSKFVLYEGKSGYWWVEESFSTGLKIVYIYMAVVLMQNKRKIETNPEAKNFYPFFLLTFAIINVIQFVPVLGARYLGMWKIFIMFLWFKTFHFSKKQPYWLLLFFSSFFIVRRYGYILGGALAVNTSPDIFFTPLPYLIGKGLFW